MRRPSAQKDSIYPKTTRFRAVKFELYLILNVIDLCSCNNENLALLVTYPEHILGFWSFYVITVVILDLYCALKIWIVANFLRYLTKYCMIYLLIKVIILQIIVSVLVLLCTFLKLATRWVDAWRNSMIFTRSNACDQISRSSDLIVAII